MAGTAVAYVLLFQQPIYNVGICPVIVSWSISDMSLEWGCDLLFWVGCLRSYMVDASWNDLPTVQVAYLMYKLMNNDIS